MVEDRNILRGEQESQQGVFVGHFTHSLDPKKRLTIPSLWRELAGSQRRLFVLPVFDVKCLRIYPAFEMTLFRERLRELSKSGPKGRQFARTLGSRSDWVAWDSQGRIRIKDELLGYAGLANQVELVGTFDGFELWSPNAWKAESESVDEPLIEEAAREVGFS